MNKPKLEISGEETFNAPPDRVFALLTNLQTLATTIPDLESSELVDVGTLRCVVKPGFSFLRGTLKLSISLVDESPPVEGQPEGTAGMEVEAAGVGTNLGIFSEMHVLPTEDGGTLLRWNAKVHTLKGLVATVSKPLIQAAAGQVAKKTWAKIRTEHGL